MKHTKRLIATLAVLLSLGTLSGCKSDKIRIGILQPLEHAALSASREGFIAGLAEKGYDESKIEIDYKNALDDSASLVTMASSLVNRSDLILSIGTGATQKLVASATSAGYDKPILFTAVTDPIDAKIVASNEVPGANITGTSDINPVEDQIALIKEISPTAKKVGILYTASEDNSEVQANMAKVAATTLGLEVKVSTIDTASEIAAKTSALAKEVDAIFIPTDNLLASNMPLVTSKANDESCLLVCGEEGMINNGGHITLSINYYELGRITGHMAADILDGASPSTMAIQSIAADKCSIVINQESLRIAGITLPESIMNRVSNS